jgi:hypothetical protein
MVKGQFMIAIAQGFVDALLLKMVGVDFFIFWFVLITFLSIIPLGGGGSGGSGDGSGGDGGLWRGVGGGGVDTGYGDGLRGGSA